MRTRSLVFAALVALSATGCATTSTAAGPGATSGGKVPDFELLTVDGDKARLSDSVGKGVVLLSFWDTWCEPCKAELPQLEKLFQKHHGAGLTVLSVAMDDATTVAAVAPYVKRSGFTFPVLLDTAGAAANLFNPNKTAPYTVLIDRAGAVAHEKAGYEPGEEVALEEKIVALLAKGATPAAAAEKPTP